MIVFYFGKMSILRAQYAEAALRSTSDAGLSEHCYPGAGRVGKTHFYGNHPRNIHCVTLIGFPENFFPSGEAIFPYTLRWQLSSRQQMLL